MRVGAHSAAKWSISELSSFYIAHRVEIVSRANRWLRDPHRAEEVAQDALVKFILAAPELTDTNHARAYIFKTVDNICTDIFRREGRRPNLVALDSSSSEAELALQDHRDLADVLASAEDAAIVRQAISLLSPAERAALLMWEVEGRSTSEIAKELGIKEATVRHTLSRARKSLRRILSEYVIDDARGLTALDLLSVSYRKLEKIAKDGAKVALSLALLLFAFLGFTNISLGPKLQTLDELQSEVQSTTVLAGGMASNSSSSKSLSSSKLNSQPDAPSIEVTTSIKASYAKAATLTFPGLDKSGVPVGFTVTDSTGKIGALYFSGREASFAEDGVTLPFISKTISGAANILMTQTLLQDASGTSLDAQISFGRAGNWIPLLSKPISSEVERLASGNYLVTATFQVKSEVESLIAIPASAGGRDLDFAPVRVNTRILLNASKTQVLGQAIQVVERSGK